MLKVQTTPYYLWGSSYYTNVEIKSQ